MSETTPPLPELHAGQLDEARLNAVLADIEAHAEILGVTVKGGATARSDGAPWTLVEAIAALRERRIRGVQIRYRWQGDEWWDTLIADGAGARLVRMKQDYR